jgi:hypothetical protein
MQDSAAEGSNQVGAAKHMSFHRLPDIASV